MSQTKRPTRTRTRTITIEKGCDITIPWREGPARDAAIAFRDSIPYYPHTYTIEEEIPLRAADIPLDL